MSEHPQELPSLPTRPADAHKGTFGTAAIIGGCARPEATMLGAPVLSARAALRAGVGLARLVVPAPLLVDDLAQLLEATGIGLPVNDDDHDLIPHETAETLDRVFIDADAIACGPGMGVSAGSTAAVLRVVNQEARPAVLDADGLNGLAKLDDYPQEIRAPLVITPHPGEFRRLAEPLKLTLDPTDDRQRPAAAENLAQRLGCVVVLKGRRTIVSNGLDTRACERGHPCLATAGTGDVLTGLLVALIARFVAPGPRAIGSIELPKPKDKPLDLYEAARIAVEIHAIAGERWAERHHASGGMLAHELADLLPEIIESFTES